MILRQLGAADHLKLCVREKVTQSLGTKAGSRQKALTDLSPAQTLAF
jgi:hypothetical protein